MNTLTVFATAHSEHSLERHTAGGQVQAAEDETAQIYCDTGNLPFGAMADGATFTRVFAHLPVSFDWAHLSLKKSCDIIDVLVPDWITISERSNDFVVEKASDDIRYAVDEHIASRTNSIEIMPRIQFDFKSIGAEFTTKIAQLQTRTNLISDLTLALNATGASGACIDLDQFPDGARSQVDAFMGELRSSLEAIGLRSCVILSGNGTGWLEFQFLNGFDHVILKLFDEPWLGSTPSPLSENAWFLDTVRHAIETIDVNRLVVAIGSFGAKWETGAPLPQKLSYGEVLSAVTKAKAELSYNSQVSGSYSAFS